MLVRLTQQRDKQVNWVAVDAWLKRDETYLVLHVTAAPGGRVGVRVDHTVGLPGIWDSRCFEIVSGLVPTNWIVTILDQGLLSVGPRAWAAPRFWDDLDDLVHTAVTSFNEERATMRASESAGFFIPPE